jgi:hypothetical protein
MCVMHILPYFLHPESIVLQPTNNKKERPFMFRALLKLSIAVKNRQFQHYWQTTSRTKMRTASLGLYNGNYPAFPIEYQHEKTRGGKPNFLSLLGKSGMVSMKSYCTLTAATNFSSVTSVCSPRSISFSIICPASISFSPTIATNGMALALA